MASGALGLQDDPLQVYFERMGAVAMLWERRRGGASYAVLADEVDISELELALSFALLAATGRAALEVHGLPTEPPSKLRILALARNAPVMAQVLRLRTFRMNFAELDKTNGSASGLAAASVAIAFAAIEDDLRRRGFDVHVLRAAFASALRKVPPCIDPEQHHA